MRPLLAFASLLLIGLLPPAAALGQPVDSLFARGNQHYQAGEFGEALASYQQILERGTTSGALYFNMGNAYFRTGEMGQAIRYYEKARQLGIDEARLLHNLSIARERIPGDTESLQRRPFWTRAASAVDVLTFLIAGLALLLVSLAMAVYDRWEDEPPAWQPLTYGTAALAAILLLTAFGASYLQRRGQRAVVIADRAALHSAPRSDTPADTTLREGAIVDVQRRAADWTRVRLANGRTGWMPGDALGDI